METRASGSSADVLLERVEDLAELLVDHELVGQVVELDEDGVVAGIA